MTQRLKSNKPQSHFFQHNSLIQNIHVEMWWMKNPRMHSKCGGVSIAF